jgi:transcriptional regulator with XRE-family HTH domain
MALENYRHYLMGEFEKRKIRNPSYSLRAFARDLEASPSRLSEALNSKRGISSGLAIHLAAKLGLDSTDTEFFCWSVEAEHSRSPRQKLVARAALKKALAAAEELPPKTLTVVGWVTEAVLKMDLREEVTAHPDRVAGRLEVPSFMVVNALRFLTRLGLVRGTPQFKTSLAGRGHGRRLNVDYSQILEQAQKAFVRGGVPEDRFQHQAFLLEPKDLKKAEQILSRALAEIQKLEKKTKNSRVVFVAAQIFSVEKEGIKND